MLANAIRSIHMRPILYGLFADTWCNWKLVLIFVLFNRKLSVGIRRENFEKSAKDSFKNNWHIPSKTKL